MVRAHGSFKRNALDVASLFLFVCVCVFAGVFFTTRDGLVGGAGDTHERHSSQ